MQHGGRQSKHTDRKVLSSSSVLDSLRSALPTIPMAQLLMGRKKAEQPWKRAPTHTRSDEGGHATPKAAVLARSDGAFDGNCSRRSSTQSEDALSRSRTPNGMANDLIELIPGLLYFALHHNEAVTRHQIRTNPNLFFFSCDLHESYLPFAEDFGPVDLAIVVSFWRHVRSKAQHPAMRGRPLVYYSEPTPCHTTNAAFLLATYMVLEHGMSPKDIVPCFDSLHPRLLVPFRDACIIDTGFRLSLQDCLDGLVKAMTVGWFDPLTFNMEEFERMEDPLGGDMSKIGDRFFAFRCPAETSVVHAKYVNLSAGFYANTLHAQGVSAVVRLNEPTTYSAKHFTDRGVRHYELHFADCSNPSPALVEAFLDICDSEPGPVGVHCKAGLGRTGTLIALWMMKHRGFTAREAIAWLRIVRPGSVIGHQQTFLVRCERAGFVGNALGPMAGDDEEKTAVQKGKGERQGASVSSEVIGQRVADASVKRAEAQLRLPRVNSRT